MQDKIKNINSLADLQSLYTDTFGKNGTMTMRLRDMKNMDADARAALNKENALLRELFKTRQGELEHAALMEKLASQKMDVTLDAPDTPRGTIHPLTRAFAEISSILQSLGFTMHTGPEVEDDWHNFTALNTPSHHPARDMQDTFFLPNGNVMSTQTSAIQIRAM